MKEVARISLPDHGPDGGFDHAVVDGESDRLYVAHTSNDSVDVIDLGQRRHLRSLTGLTGVAGVWVDEGRRLLFTSNRGEDTASIFRLGASGEEELHRPRTGVRPNGIAFDPQRQILMVAAVGNAEVAGAPPALTFIDARTGSVSSSLRLPGRTRWALYHPATDHFYVNVADPAAVVAVAADRISSVGKSYPIPAKGPHGLEQDPGGDILYCACDQGALLSLDVRRGTSSRIGDLAGPPDVLWLNPRLKRLYAAVGEPGALDVFDLDPPRHSIRVETGVGAHTLTVDLRRNEVHVFLPGTHEDLILKDS